MTKRKNVVYIKITKYLTDEEAELAAELKKSPKLLEKIIAEVKENVAESAGAYDEIDVKVSLLDGEE